MQYAMLLFSWAPVGLHFPRGLFFAHAILVEKEADMSIEVWKDVVGYEGQYQVSDQGRVRSITFKGKARKEPLLIQPNIINQGYYRVGLFTPEKGHKNFLVHRLVATAFIPNPRNLPCVNHKDECKTNCKASNLEWCDKDYNNKYGNRTTKTERAVVMIPNEGEAVVFKSINEASRATGTPAPHIVNVCKGVRKTAHNAQWRYLNQ